MDNKDIVKKTDDVTAKAKENDDFEKENDEFGDIDSIPDDVDILSAEPPVLDLDFDEPTMDELALEELDTDNLDEDISNIDSISLDDPVKVYLKEIGRVPLLSGNEEIDLALRICEGDAAAKKRLTEANLRLVVSIAKK